MKQIQKDRYQKSRGTPRVLDICREHCGTHVTYYQKDGPGTLKRMYVDRFRDVVPDGKQLVFKRCDRLLGSRFIYEKENRSAYRMFVGAVTKKIVRRDLFGCVVGD